MTVRLRTTARTKGVERMSDAIISFPKAARKIFDDTADDIGTDLITQLSTSPGAVATPVDWTNPKQEVAARATKNWGKGSPYHRTGAVLAGWGQRTETRSDGRDVWIVENTTPHSVYVFGKLNKNLADAIRPQQRFHANTGYPLAAELTNQASADFQKLYKKRIIPKGSADFVRRASVTGGSRG